MDDSNNWDLQAVVRGCSTSAMAAAVGDPFSSFIAEEYFIEEFAQGVEDFDSFLDPMISTSTTETAEISSLHHELEQLCKPFFSISPQTMSNNPSPTRTPTTQEMRQQRPLSSNPARTKRSRRNQQKKVVCQVLADGLPFDKWAWRKYGQKPIKGSPYPRGYYRCSSSKGCLARKQVERSRTDPSMLIITYTAEHNHAVPTHRNSLTGSTCNKFLQNLTSNNTDSKAEESTSALSALTAGLSPTTPLVASMEDIEEDQEEEGGEAAEAATIGEMMGDGEEDMRLLDLEDDDDFVKSFF